MEDKTKNVLNYFYQTCLEEKREISKKLQDNLNRIEEINAFLKSIEESEESDFKVFSPRSVENIYKNELQMFKEEKLDIEKENQYHYKKINQLDKQLKEFEGINMREAEINNKEVNKDHDGESNQLDTKCRIYNDLRVLDIQEKERQRISRELHDSSLQNLTHLVHAIELGSMFIDQDPIRAKLELASCIKNLRQTIDDIRETIFNLRPMSFDDLGFKQCIENFVNSAKLQYKSYDIIYDISEIEIKDLGNNEVKYHNTQNLLFVTIFRIIQEAVINSLKHSSGNEVKLYIETEEDNCYIEIIDNGKGFDVEHTLKELDKHFGISIMKERVELLNGTLMIDSVLQKGTDIKINIPLR